MGPLSCCWGHYLYFHINSGFLHSIFIHLLHTHFFFHFSFLSYQQSHVIFSFFYFYSIFHITTWVYPRDVIIILYTYLIPQTVVLCLNNIFFTPQQTNTSLIFIIFLRIFLLLSYYIIYHIYTFISIFMSIDYQMDVYTSFSIYNTLSSHPIPFIMSKAHRFLSEILFLWW